MAEIAMGVKSKKAPKVLHHLEIHPKMGGGVIVQHHYQGFQHEPEHHKFEDEDGHKAMKHIAKHAGLPHPELEEQGESEPEPYDEG